MGDNRSTGRVQQSFGSERRIQQPSGERKIIAYKLVPVEAGSSSMLPCMMQSMISGKTLSTSGGGGDFISAAEYEVIKTNALIKDQISSEANRPKPKPVKVLISLIQGYDYKDVSEALQAQGFAYEGKLVVGTTVIINGEIYDSYIDEVRKINAIDGIAIQEA